MTNAFHLNGHVIPLNAPSDHAVAQRVASHFQRRLSEDDWRPYRTRDEAVKAWSKLGGIRVAVMKALDLL